MLHAFVRQINEDAASFLREELMPEMQAYLGGHTTRGFSRAAMSLDIKICWSLPHHFYPRGFQG